MNRVKRLSAPDLNLIREYFAYTKDGKLINRRTRNHNKVGYAAGKTASHGYLKCGFNGKVYYTHHLVYYHQTGIWPNMLDHINGIRSDNRLHNLREASSVDNNRNHKRRCTNKSGVTGVSFSKQSSVWVANIYDKGKKKHLGQSKIFEDAVKLRREAEVRLGYIYHNNQRI